MEYRLPELGEGIYEADFVAWLVQSGQWVESGTALAEVTTDKATMELPAPFAGRIESLLVEPGQTVEVGQVILYYAQGDAFGGCAGVRGIQWRPGGGHGIARDAAGTLRSVTFRGAPFRCACRRGTIDTCLTGGSSAGAFAERRFERRPGLGT